MLLISALMSLTSCFYDKYHVRRDWSHLLRGPNPGPKRCLVNWTTSVLEQHMRYFYTLGPQNLSVLGLDGFCSHFSIPYWDESLAAASPSPPSLLSSFLVKGRHAPRSAPWHCPDRCHLASAEDHNIRDVCPGIPCIFALLFGTHLS